MSAAPCERCKGAGYDPENGDHEGPAPCRECGGAGERDLEAEEDRWWETIREVERAQGVLDRRNAGRT